jgi:hypothetical protein
LTNKRVSSFNTLKKSGLLILLLSLAKQPLRVVASSEAKQAAPRCFATEGRTPKAASSEAKQAALKISERYFKKGIRAIEAEGIKGGE